MYEKQPVCDAIWHGLKRPRTLSEPLKIAGSLTTYLYHSVTSISLSPPQNKKFRYVDPRRWRAPLVRHSKRVVKPLAANVASQDNG